MQKVKALIVNRDLVSTLRNTVDFLKKEDRIEIWIIDNASTYPPLLEYYRTNPCNIHYCHANRGPHSIWRDEIPHLIDNNPYIVADSDCTYDNIPDDWLDVMLNVLHESNVPKVGFSLNIDDLPNTKFADHQRIYQQRFWEHKTQWGFRTDIDTTFALYRTNSSFTYDAIRLDKPYCIKHVAWYLSKDNISDEWKYYIQNSSSISTCKRWLNDIIQ